MLVVICSATAVNCTSWLVKVLASIGLVGSWFFSCVVSSDRKSLKLPANCVSVLVAETAVAALAVVDIVLAAVAELSYVAEMLMLGFLSVCGWVAD